MKKFIGGIGLSVIYLMGISVGLTSCLDSDLNSPNTY